MKTKSKKLLSLFLAVVMAVSASMTCFSAYAAKADYGEQATEEQFEFMLEDLNTILDGVLPTLVSGSTIETIMGIFPSLSSLLYLDGTSYQSNSVNYYLAWDAEFYADLADYCAEGTTTVDSTVLAAFFEDHPIEVADEEEFTEKLLDVVNTFMCSNIANTIPFALLMTDPMMGGDGSGAAFANALDDLCAALGIDQPLGAEYAFGASYNGSAAGQYSQDAMQTYLDNIVTAIVPLLSSIDEDASGTIVSLLKSLLTDDELVGGLYPAVTDLLANLSGIVNALSSQLAGLIDLDSVVSTIDTINNYWAYVQTTETADGLYLDIPGTVNNLIGSFISGYSLDLTALDYETLAAAETDADFVKMVYDYLYENLVGNETNNLLINTLLSTGLLEGLLGFTIPEEIKTPILDALTMENDELAYYIITLVAEAAGRDMNPDVDEPSTGDDPTVDDPSGDDTTGDGTTGDDTTGDGTTGDGTTGDGTTTTGTVTTTNIPNTGRIYDGITAASVIVFLGAAAALAIVLISAKKKVTE